MLAPDALALFLESLSAKPGSRVLDVGSGSGEHAVIIQDAGHRVETCDLIDGVNYMIRPTRPQSYDGIWCSHVLEHQTNPGDFLRKLRTDLKPGGLLAVTVPPLKHQIVGGHVTLWNAGILLYQLILAGFDCQDAAIKRYDYNISVLLRRRDIVDMPALRMDSGDINKLARFFPFPVGEGFDGNLREHQWRTI